MDYCSCRPTRFKTIYVCVLCVMTGCLPIQHCYVTQCTTWNEINEEKKNHTQVLKNATRCGLSLSLFLCTESFFLFVLLVIWYFLCVNVRCCRYNYKKTLTMVYKLQRYAGISGAQHTCCVYITHDNFPFNWWNFILLLY